jgi:hypothetical protein
MREHDGGPAYPGEKATRFGQDNDCNEGMTLRDYFAGQALERCMSLCMDQHGGWDPVNVAACAYAMADAMLHARATPTTTEG